MNQTIPPSEEIQPEETLLDESRPRSTFFVDMQLFWIFLKVNLMTTAGPTSVGLLYKETVGKIMSEAKFVQAVGLSTLLPGSDALQLAMFVGYSVGGTPGVIAALLGAIIPPTVLMFTVASIILQFEGEAWMTGFIEGMTPSISILLVLVAWQLYRSSSSQSAVKWRTILIIVLSFIALVVLQVPPHYVLIGAGVFGIFLFR